MKSAEQAQAREWFEAAQQALARREFRAAHELCLRVLRQAPQHGDALFLLGVIAAEHGNFAKAAEVIERAIRCDPTRSEYHAQLGRCLTALLQPHRALASARAAARLSPANALTLDTIGVTMAHAGAHEESLSMLQRAVELAPQVASYHYNLGASLRFAAQFDAAERAYRRALALDPRCFRAWSSLAQLRRAPFDVADLAQLHELLAQEPDADAQLHVAHALAKQHEDTGSYAQAFACLERGKQAKRATLYYSHAHDAELFAAVREVCTPESLRVAARGSDAPVFVVGMPRTGTTLVERILSTHPAVFAAGELNDFALALKRAAHTPSPQVLDPPTLRAAADIDLAAVGAAYLDSTLPRAGHSARFVDKLPLNFLYAGLIHRALPRARIICVRRNPLDTCLSNYRQLFATRFPYYNYAYDLLDTGRYFLQFNALADYWRRHIDANYCEVHYEALIERTEAEARRLVDFCGLQWDPACLSFQHNPAPVSTASSVQVRQPIYRSALHRWRSYEHQLAPLRALLNEAGVNC